MQGKADNLAMQAATGTLQNPHDYLIAATEASLTTQMTVAVADLRPATAYQMGLFAPQPGDSSPFYRAMQRLIAKHRQCGFYLAALTEHSHPLPERRFQLESLAHDPALA